MGLECFYFPQAPLLDVSLQSISSQTAALVASPPHYLTSRFALDSAAINVTTGGMSGMSQLVLSPDEAATATQGLWESLVNTSGLSPAAFNSMLMGLLGRPPLLPPSPPSPPPISPSSQVSFCSVAL